MEDMSSAVVLNHINHALLATKPLDDSFYSDIRTIQVPSGKIVFFFKDREKKLIKHYCETNLCIFQTEETTSTSQP